MTHQGSTDRPGSSFRLFDQPWLLFVLPPLFWSGNIVIGRAVSGEVPPVGLAFWRWTLGCLIVLPFALRHLRRDLPAIRRHFGMVLVLSALGISAYNTFVYVGLQYTTALNGVMMQSMMPVLIVLASLVLFRDAISPLQVLGVAVSLAGAMLIVSGGNPAALAGLEVNRGDLWILVAVLCYALYTALLRRRPLVHPLSFLAVIFGLGALMLLPFMLAEMWAGRSMPLTPGSMGALFYVALFPSIVAYLCFNRTVELLGANRTGLSVHLVPAFGSAFAILFLGEDPRWYHGAGIALIAAGILLASRRR
jgi:drug/metabolite transporter (DMT)-like permease